MKTIPAFLCFSGLLFASPSFAHHSLVSYDEDVLETVSGTLESLEWSNPHTRLNLMVENSRGDASVLSFDGGDVARLIRNGWDRDAVAPGDRIAVSFNPNRDGSAGGFFLAVTTVDGTIYSLARFRRYAQ